MTRRQSVKSVKVSKKALNQLTARRNQPVVRLEDVAAADGTIKGWYCDVARPARIASDEIALADLDLDLWLSGDRTTVLRLDEDEFAESGLSEREPETAAAALRALDELAALAAEGFAGLLEW